jgi:hypothetical protein
MRLYARSDVLSVSVPPPVGHIHTRKIIEKAKKNADAVYADEFWVDCSECEEALLATGQWAKSPDSVEKTPTELEREKKDALEAEISMKNAGLRLLAEDRAARAAI